MTSISQAAVSSRSSPDVSLSHLWTWLSPRALRRLPALLAVIVTMLAGIALELLAPWPMKILVDNVLQGHALRRGGAGLAAVLPRAMTREELLSLVIAGTIALFLLGWILSLAKSRAGIAFGRRLVFDLSADVFAHLQRLSLRFHRRSTVGDLMRRVTGDCGAASTIVTGAVIPSVSAVITLGGMFVVMWRLDSQLALLSLAVIPPILITLRLHMKPMLERSYEQQQIEGKLYSLVEQTLSAIPIVKAFRREKEVERNFNESARELLDATLASSRVQLRFKVLVGLATATGTGAIVWVGGTHALDGRLTIGGVLVFLTYLRGFYGPLNTIVYAPPTIQQAAGSARRVLEVLEHEPEVPERSDAVELHEVKGRLHFENLHAGYELDRTILHAIDLVLEPGEMTAIVGKTGAGKTTLVSLVPRFLDPWQGRVMIDGNDIREFTLASLRQKIAIVSQDVFLFPRTVAENIAYGRPAAEMAEVEAAARSAQADAFIRRLPDGYETVLGERGATLSGGERQRISIARAFLTGAPILILDEATSALDTETEALLVQALAELRHGRTVLVIAHRLSTVRNADKLVVLEEGRIVECGPPDDLLEARGQYARFHMLQSGLISDDRTRSVAVG